MRLLCAQLVLARTSALAQMRSCVLNACFLLPFRPQCGGLATHSFVSASSDLRLIHMTLRWAQVRSEKDHHLSRQRSFCFEARDPNFAMSVEQAIHELQEQLQRVSAGHRAMHQELTTLRSMEDTRSRVRLVEPKTLMPDQFGKRNGPSWRTWSYLARDFVGVVHEALKQAMKSAENQKQPISVTHLQHEFNVTNEMDQELQHLLITRTEGEALEIARGAEREPGLEQWRRLAALCDPTSSWEESERQQANPVSAESCPN